jgi:hypothetical protein
MDWFIWQTHPNPPPRRLARAADLGARTHPQKRAAAFGAFAALRARVNELNEGPAVGSLPR